MSFRVLKKLQQNAENQLPIPDESDDLSDDDKESLRGKDANLNPFDLLNQQSLSESEFKEDDNETEHASMATNLPTGSHAQVPKQKKKKKRKKKAKNAGNHISSEDNESLALAVRPQKMDNFKIKATTSQQPDLDLFAVELKHLNPQNEMRRTFGKRVVKMEFKRGRQKLSLKNTYMVSSRESWPAVHKNMITMKSVDRPEYSITCNNKPNEQLLWFAFEHSEDYQNVQRLFFAAIERADTDFLISLIRRLPYHVDSIIQLGELCKMTEDYALASELIERALYVLEISLHPSFSLTSGNCRLDYRRQENRAFFIVIFKHAQYLESRACSRTAFELAKFLHNLNPEIDPLAMVLILDYYALRSKQYQWIVDFYERYNSFRNLNQLPNMAYSYALSLFLLNKDNDAADKALQYALLMFPGVLRPLLDELNVHTDSRVIGSSYFNADIKAHSPALAQLTSLYVCRAKVIWRHDDILPWLEKNFNIVLDMIDSKEPAIHDFKEKRDTRYVNPPRTILRHVILSDFKEKVPLAPFLTREMSPLVMYDPLPPPDTINFYEKKTAPDNTPTQSNRRISTFFSSILPSYIAGMHRNNVAVEAAADLIQGELDPAVPVAPAALPAVAANDRERARERDLRVLMEAINQPAVQQELAADDQFDFERQLDELDTALSAAYVNEVGTNTQPVQNRETYLELTQSLHSIVGAMRDVLNFRGADNVALDLADEMDSTSIESDVS